MPIEHAGSSWGQPADYIDVRSLKRYQRLLQRLDLLGESLVFVFVVGLCIGFPVLMTKTNFEHAIFDDGSGNVCLFDGDQEIIRHVR